MTNRGEVDHFIPWSKYPRDLAHNFVLAHSECNRRKSDMLAAERHLDTWLVRDEQYGDVIAAELASTVFLADQRCSRRVAHWAYQQGIQTSANGWIKAKKTEALKASCLSRLSSFVNY